MHSAGKGLFVYTNYHLKCTEASMMEVYMMEAYMDLQLSSCSWSYRQELSLFDAILIPNLDLIKYT